METNKPIYINTDCDTELSVCIAESYIEHGDTRESLGKSICVEIADETEADMKVNLQAAFLTPKQAMKLAQVLITMANELTE